MQDPAAEIEGLVQSENGGSLFLKENPAWVWMSPKAAFKCREKRWRTKAAYHSYLLSCIPFAPCPMDLEYKTQR